jgi:large subunit ribosomal protein L17
MVHRVSQKKLSREKDARRALLKSLANSLILHEKIITTQARAKAVRPFVEKLVTQAKEETLETRRYLLAKLGAENAVRKLLELVGPTFKERAGGYTRIIKLTPRGGDAADMAVLEFVENVSEAAAKKKLEEKPTKQKEQKGEEEKVGKPAERKEDQKSKRSAKDSKAKVSKNK